MTDQFVVYRDHQYTADTLPAGADPAEVVPLDEYFLAARGVSHKAVKAPRQGRPSKGETKAPATEASAGE